MYFLGTNAASIMNKSESFYRNINLFKPAAFFLQETKTRFKNKLKHPEYSFFEYIRKNGGGGGLITAVHNSLHPVSVGSVDDGDNTEVIVVEAKVDDYKVRLINGYGPQESDEEESKAFMNRLDLEVKKAKLAGAFVCIEMDANSKLGPSIVKGDPNQQSRNGKLLSEVIDVNNLVVVNGSDICDGTITRQRDTVGRSEKSVIDFFIVCQNFFQLIKRMEIDEQKKYSLCSYSKRNGVVNIKNSDHNLLFIEVDLKWKTFLGNKREEIFNFNDDEGLKKFIDDTSDNPAMRLCFDNENEDLDVSSSRWLRLVNSSIKTSFRKIRIGKHRINPELDILFQRKESLVETLSKLENAEDFHGAEKVKDDLNDVEEDIAKICCDTNKRIVDDYLGSWNDAIEGFSQPKTWKLKKKLAPKNTFDPPAAKKDKSGNLITDKKGLESLYIDTYKDRLEPNKIADGLDDLKHLKEYLFNLRLKHSSLIISEDWKKADLDKVLKSLKNGKARDPHGHIYELYRYGGKDLKYSLLKLCNLVKRTQKYPDILQLSNISSFYKKKGDKSDLNNDRGVFNVVKIRSIIDKLIYNDKYNIIDQSMSGSNIGGRKGRNIRDHLFVINGILNDVMKTKQNVDIEIMDIAKCFDKMWFEETANDLFKAGVNDDKFVLLANSNSKCQVAVKTPWGSTTERIVLEKIEMQGTVPAPLKASVQLDTLGKECLENNDGLFKYKGCVNLTPLIFVDDILSVSVCGNESVKMNAIIQSKVETKQLKFSDSKCFKLHVGNGCKNTCPALKVQDQIMSSVEKETYLGDVLSANGKIDENILARQNKGTGYVNQIMSMLKELSFGYHYFNMAMLFRTSMLINGMLCSSEALYGIKKSHIEKLESCDKMLFKSVFQSPCTTPTVAYYLETGSVQIKYLLKGRRIMYLWNILQKSDQELARKVYDAQKQFRVKDDWIEDIEQDLDEFGIEFDEEKISKMKNENFKKIVIEKMRELAHSSLLAEKDGKEMSKLSGLSSHYGMKDYLETERLSIKEKQLLFNMRTRMVTVRTNYKMKYGTNLSCTLCTTNTEDSQEHLLDCPGLYNVPRNSSVKHADIFDHLDKKIEAVKYFSKLIKERRIKLKEMELSQ